MPYCLEVTDTFGGEANYCWVERGTTRATTTRGLVKALKALCPYDMGRVEVTELGDGIEVRPANRETGPCVVGFAFWED